MAEYIYEIESYENDEYEVFIGWIRHHSQELIRCKDCKHCREYCRVVEGIRTDYACDILDEHDDPYGKKRVALDDYCRWAERKEE